jgi:hypothetical protein
MTVNLGLRPLEIELLYFEGCPGYNETLGILRKAVVEVSLAARVVPIVLGYDDNRPGFSGSPTVLVDGEDLFTAEHHAPGQDCAMSCRIRSILDTWGRFDEVLYMLEQKRKRFDQELRRLTLAAASTFGHCYPSVLVAYGDLDDGAARLASANPDNDSLTPAEASELRRN